MFQTHKPARHKELSPLYTHHFHQPWSLDEAIRQTVTQPILESEMTEDGERIDVEKLKNMVAYLCGHSSGSDEEKQIREMLSLVLDHFDKNATPGFDQVFPIQSLARTGLPSPDRTIIYTIEDDLIPACETFHQSGSNYDELLCAASFSLRPSGMVIYCRSHDSFRKFQEWFSMKMGIAAGNRPEWMTDELESRTERFLDLALDKMTLSFWIRARLDQANEPFSFARILTSAILSYCQICDSKDFGILPCSYRGLLCPQTLTFMNIQSHSMASAGSIYRRWRAVKAGSVMQPEILTQEAIIQLEDADEAIENLENSVLTSIQKLQNPKAYKRTSKFDDFDGTVKDYRQILTRILKRMSRVSHSGNVIRKEIHTFARASRRYPDDYNRKGIRRKSEYLPDIHLYVDTSGSISFEDYKSSVLTCIRIAKSLGVDIYFNSFSTVLSEEFRFDIRKSFKAIRRDFERITPVTGGTRFDAVWRYIQASGRRRKELSIMITDFGYTASDISIDHPENLYYIPCGDGVHANRYIGEWAEQFMNSMLAIYPKIESRILL